MQKCTYVDLSCIITKVILSPFFQVGKAETTEKVKWVNNKQSQTLSNVLIKKKYYTILSPLPANRLAKTKITMSFYTQQEIMHETTN
jgi:hypothetical protein